MDRRTALVVEAVTAATGRYLDAVTTLAAAVGATDTLTTTRFAQMTAPLHKRRLAGATSVALLVPATDEEIPAVAAAVALARRRRPHAAPVGRRPRARVRGAQRAARRVDDGRRSASTAPRHRPRPPRSTRPAGPTRRPSPTRTTCSATEGLPPEQRQLSFVLTAPVHGPAGADGRRPFLGWVLMGLRGQDFVTAALARPGRGW